MRPSSAETSDPACVKRKMLSMNSSVSAPVSSRKYSAIISAPTATRTRAPGASIICPTASTVWPTPLHAHRPAVVDRVAQQVEHPPQRLLAHRHRERPAGVNAVHAAPKPVGRPQRDRPDLAAAQVAGHLADQLDGHAIGGGVDLD